MCPVFSFGGCEIHAYALFTWIGAAAACLLAFPALRRAGMTASQTLAALVLMCAAFFVGARLWNLAVSPDNYLGPLTWNAPKLAGLSFYGGALGAGLALYGCVKACKTRLLPALDAMVVPAGAAFCCARIGCFLNGCCGGKATDGPFGVVFADGTVGQTLPGFLSFVNARPVHPTQLYELAGAAIALAVVVWICRRSAAPPGVRFLLYAAGFSAVRLAVLPLRALTYPDVVKNVFYPGLYLAIIVVCSVRARALMKGCR